MIPRILHYLWLSDEPRPELMRRCIASWQQVMPDFQIRHWSLADFDQSALPLFAQQAIALKQWAFASDVLRLWLLGQHGGVYFDADVLAVRSLEPLLGYEAFTAVEFNPLAFAAGNGAAWLDADGNRRAGVRHQGPPPGIGLQAAVLGAVAGHPFLRSCLAYYECRPFLEPDGSWHRDPIAPGIYGLAAEQHGFRWINHMQKLSHGVVVLPAEIIASTKAQYGRNTLAFHCCAGSWRQSMPQVFPSGPS
ncbi:glycosyltransferase [Synechococcus sp. CCY9201]|uniref:glycosyltransferase family 32 protein n=1 Tax=Synechococcus sp. CCY9201 TaxID=174697 RepID=UPI002B207F49|nr:glycosyltransferase [Synechococcus sp. CCY9201]MEA5472770.1 glycosyltransferase [Synechococcus sp. CCY9201]